MVYILLQFHSFNKYMMSAYSIHMLDLAPGEQDTYKPCPPRAHILKERADTKYFTV